MKIHICLNVLYYLWECTRYTHLLFGWSVALSENQERWGFTAISDDDPGLDDIDDRERRILAIAVSLEPDDPVTCRIIRPLQRTAIVIDANNPVGRSYLCDNICTSHFWGEISLLYHFTGKQHCPSPHCVFVLQVEVL